MTLPPRVRLLHLVGGFMITKSIGVAVRLGIPDLVTERPRPVRELAETTGADSDALGRLLRALASVGVFAEQDGVIEHTELSELLRRDVPGSLNGLSEVLSGEHYRVWSDAGETFRTGEPAFARVHGQLFFDWLDKRPDEAATFNRAMASGAALRRQVLLDRNWSPVDTVVDIGGGTGVMLTTLLAANEHLHGVVFDLAHAREGAERTIAEAGVADRCSFAAGSFFDEVPAGADVYVLSQILHDWDDESAGRILRACRKAVTERSRLLLVEGVVEPGNEADWSKILDLHMLVLLGGRERSEDQWRRLLEQGGFELQTRQPGVLLLEATPV